MVLLVVVGAGASHDSNPVLASASGRELELREGLSRVKLRLGDICPPLTFDLFSARLAFLQFVTDYGAVRPLRAQLVNADDTVSLEERLAGYEAKADKYPDRHAHLIALRFYLRDIIRLCTEGVLSIAADGGQTNYVPLVQQLREWAEDADDREVACVSFNYDTLLEQASSDVWRFDDNTLDGYLSDPYFKVLKPHGSIDWIRPITDSQLDRRSYSNGPHRARVERAQWAIEAAGPDLQLGPIQIGPDPFGSTGSGPITVPAVAAPIKEKHTFEWPDQQRLYIQGLTKKVDRLLVIGWRALDQHFVQLLQPTFTGSALPTLIITGGERKVSEAEGRAIAVRLGVTGGGGEDSNITYCPGGFSEAIEAGVIRYWLSEERSA